MPRLMIDSDDTALLLQPRFAGMTLGAYADIVTPEQVAQAAGRMVVIDRGLGDPHAIATVADIEPGAHTVESGAALVKQWDAEHRPFPTAYHDRAQWEAVNAALEGVKFAHWVATLDGTLVPSGYYMAVVQFAPAAVLGFHADMSIVWDDGWHPMPGAPSPVALADLEHVAAVVAQGAAQLAAMARKL